jgi:hypothetical protein
MNRHSRVGVLFAENITKIILAPAANPALAASKNSRAVRKSSFARDRPAAYHAAEPQNALEPE